MSPMQVLAADREAFSSDLRRRFAVIVGGGAACVVAVAVALILLVGPIIGVVIPVVLAAGGAVIGYRLYAARAPGLVLEHLTAQRADPVGDARLFNVVEGLCVTHGVPEPEVRVLDEAGLNACAIGLDPRDTTLVVTRGACDTLSRIELEAVVARLLAAVKSQQVARLTRMIATAGLPAAMTESGGMSFLAGMSQRAFATLLEEHVVAHADLAGATTTRYPPGLASALDVIRSSSAVVARATRADAHLWIADPLDVASHGAGPFDVFPSLTSRVAALHEL